MWISKIKDNLSGETLLEYLLFIIGFLVSIVIGMTGIGGAIFITPLLILLGVPPLYAIGSSMLFLAVNKSWASFLHFLHKNIDYKVLKLLTIGILPAILIGYYTLYFFKQTFNVALINKTLIVILSIVLIAIGIRMLNYTRINIKIRNDPSLKRSKVVTFLVGLFITFLIQLTSIGSGSLMIPYLMNIIEEPRRMVGTSVVYSFLVAIFATLAHYELGNVRFEIFYPLIIGSVPGTILGVKLVNKIKRTNFSLAVGFFLIISSTLLVMKSFAFS